MEFCMEERALKSSVRGELTMQKSNQCVVFDDLLCQNGAVAGEDFSVDCFFDFTNGEFENEEENSAFIFSKEQSVAVADDDSNSNSSSFSFDSVLTNELSVPDEEIAGLEWVSQLMDDTVPELQFSCPVFKQQSQSQAKARFEPEPEAVFVKTPCFSLPVPCKSRSKRAKPTGKTWSVGSIPLSESLSSTTVSSSSSASSGFSMTSAPVLKTELSDDFPEPPTKKQRRKPGVQVGGGNAFQRRCSHCQVQKTPQWRTGTAAAAGGSGPREHCDVISQAYKMLWNDLDIAYDKFIRTTDPKHEAIVEEFYSRVLANDDIYRADYEGLYCVNCEEYKDEKELLENNCCPTHLKPCVPRKEDNYFFALSKYQKSLEEILAQNPDFVQPSYRLNEVQSWIKNGLRDFSISRAAVDWGIPVPNDNKQTIYVWFDALLGYISALLEDKDQPNLQSAVSLGWPASLHLIGKDILRFHAVYWPAMLMSAGLSLPKRVFGHGFLTKDGMKMGKSLGNTIEPNELVHKFGADAVRYFFLREVEFGNDGDYSEDRFINIVNAHLANTIGNLLNRTLGLLKKNCQSTLVVDSSIAAEGKEFKDTVEKLVEKTRIHYENLALSSACEAVLEIGNAGNLYMDKHQPWSLFKQGDDASEAAAKDLVIILETMRIIAIALSPVTPSLCRRIHAQLGYSEDQFDNLNWSETKWGGLKGGQVMAQPKPVFARIEQIKENENGGAEAPKKVVKKKEKKKQVQGVMEA